MKGKRANTCPGVATEFPLPKIPKKALPASSALASMAQAEGDPFHLRCNDRLSGFRRHMLFRMMAHGDLFSNRPANDYPLFKSSWDAADRLVSWMREHGMHSALVLQEQCLYPAHRKIAACPDLRLLWAARDSADIMGQSGEETASRERKTLRRHPGVLSTGEWRKPVDVVVLPTLCWSPHHNSLMQADDFRVLRLLERLCEESEHASTWNLLRGAKFVAFASHAQIYLPNDMPPMDHMQAHAVVTAAGVVPLPGAFHGCISSSGEPMFRPPDSLI